MSKKITKSYNFARVPPALNVRKLISAEILTQNDRKWAYLHNNTKQTVKFN